MNVPPGEPVPMVCRKSQREVRPVIKLSYDELGHPADRPLTLVHRGMVVHTEGAVQDKEGLSYCMVPPNGPMPPMCSHKPLPYCQNSNSVLKIGLVS